jgi:hypothetical protein
MDVCAGQYANELPITGQDFVANRAKSVVNGSSIEVDFSE